jgi:radical SAM-linked protein
MSASVTRVRARFLKGEEVKFISHLDLAHSMERAARRARLPLAFSEGFHPMPKISFAAPLAVGTTSESEFVDIDLSEVLTHEEVSQRLNGVFPKGLAITESATLPLEAKSLQAVVNLAKYVVRPGFCATVAPGELAEEIRRLFSLESLRSVRGTGHGNSKEVDVRPFLAQWELVPGPERLTLKLAIRMGPKGSAKPEEYFRLLPWPLERFGAHRTGLYVERGSELLSPLEVVR